MTAEKTAVSPEEELADSILDRVDFIDGDSAKKSEIERVSEEEDDDDGWDEPDADSVDPVDVPRVPRFRIGKTMKVKGGARHYTVREGEITSNLIHDLDQLRSNGVPLEPVED